MCAPRVFAPTPFQSSALHSPVILLWCRDLNSDLFAYAADSLPSKPSPSLKSKDFPLMKPTALWGKCSLYSSSKDIIECIPSHVQGRHLGVTHMYAAVTSQKSSSCGHGIEFLHSPEQSGGCSESCLSPDQ